jgi:hypothetical protein
MFRLTAGWNQGCPIGMIDINMRWTVSALLIVLTTAESIIIITSYTLSWIDPIRSLRNTDIAATRHKEHKKIAELLVSRYFYE